MINKHIQINDENEVHLFDLSSFFADRTILKHSLFVSIILDKPTPLCFTIFLIRYSLFAWIFLGRMISEQECCMPRSTECFTVILSSVLLLCQFLLRAITSSSLLALRSKTSFISFLLTIFLFIVLASFTSLGRVNSTHSDPFSVLAIFYWQSSKRLYVVLDLFLEDTEWSLLLILLDLTTPVSMDSIFLRSSQVLCVARMMEDIDQNTVFVFEGVRFTSIISQTQSLMLVMIRFISVRKSEKQRIISL